MLYQKQIIHELFIDKGTHVLVCGLMKSPCQLLTLACLGLIQPTYFDSVRWVMQQLINNMILCTVKVLCLFALVDVTCNQYFFLCVLMDPTGLSCNVNTQYGVLIYGTFYILYAPRLSSMFSITVIGSVVATPWFSGSCIAVLYWRYIYIYIPGIYFFCFCLFLQVFLVLCVGFLCQVISQRYCVGVGYFFRLW